MVGRQLFRQYGPKSPLATRRSSDARAATGQRWPPSEVVLYEHHRDHLARHASVDLVSDTMSTAVKVDALASDPPGSSASLPRPGDRQEKRAVFEGFDVVGPSAACAVSCAGGRRSAHLTSSTSRVDSSCEGFRWRVRVGHGGEQTTARVFFTQFTMEAGEDPEFPGLPILAARPVGASGRNAARSEP